MPNGPAQNEQYILRFVAPKFDPNTDYAYQKQKLVKKLSNYGRCPGGGAAAVDGVIKLVKSRIHNPKLRGLDFDLNQQRAFLEWLKGVKAELGPTVHRPKKKPLSKGRKVEAHKQKKERFDQRRARTRKGLLNLECQNWQSNQGKRRKR